MRILLLVSLGLFFCGCTGSTTILSNDPPDGDLDVEQDMDFDSASETDNDVTEDGDLSEVDMDTDDDMDEDSTETEIEHEIYEEETQDGDEDSASESEEDMDSDVNTYGIEWAEIPAGSFLMGCRSNDENCGDHEYPQITVTLPAFKMMTTEVTQEQYEEVMGNNPSYYHDCPDCPVENVTWYNAKDFCEAVGVRLPSHSEWKYAARAGRDSIYICDDVPDCIDNYAWSDRNAARHTHPVGIKLPNNWGLHDVEGNVNEYVQDCYSGTLENTPRDGSPTTGCTTGKVVWTGANIWSVFPQRLRLSRYGARDPYFSYGALGFRCAKDD